MKRIALFLITASLIIPQTGRASTTQARSISSVIVKMKSGFAPTREFLSRYNLIDAKQLSSGFKKASYAKHLAKTGLDRIYTLRTVQPDIGKLLTAISADQRIEYAEPNLQVGINQSPNDPRLSEQWALEKIDAPAAWETTTSSELPVAVIDTGIRKNHEDLQDNIWTNQEEIPDNKIDDDQNGFMDDVYGWDFFWDDADPWDDLGHGTHVAGIIGARGNNALGVAGAAWSIKIVSLKFIGPNGFGEISDAVEALMYADMMGIRLTNNSWGWGGGEFSQALYDAVSASNELGHLFLAAAGNGSSDNDESPFYPASFDSTNIVSVAATDSNDLLANFSNYGASSVDLAAPGVDILSTFPVGECAELLKKCIFPFDTSCLLCDNDGYRPLSGTSMATPMVVGAAALYWSLHQGLSHLQVKTDLLRSVESVQSLQNKTLTGGRLNLNNFLALAD